MIDVRRKVASQSTWNESRYHPYAKLSGNSFNFMSMQKRHILFKGGTAEGLLYSKWYGDDGRRISYIQNRHELFKRHCSSVCLPINLSIDGHSIRIRCTTHEFALVFSGFSPFYFIIV